jgi:hypothetical protein
MPMTGLELGLAATAGLDTGLAARGQVTCRESWPSALKATQIEVAHAADVKQSLILTLVGSGLSTWKVSRPAA